MSTVNDLCQAMERIAPTGHAADWDNVGLLVDTLDTDDEIGAAGKVLLTNDLTDKVSCLRAL